MLHCKLHAWQIHICIDRGMALPGCWEMCFAGKRGGERGKKQSKKIKIQKNWFQPEISLQTPSRLATPLSQHPDVPHRHPSPGRGATAAPWPPEHLCSCSSSRGAWNAHKSSWKAAAENKTKPRSAYHRAWDVTQQLEPGYVIKGWQTQSSPSKWSHLMRRQTSGGNIKHCPCLEQAFICLNRYS